LQLVAVLGHSSNNSDKLIHTKTCLHFSHTFYCILWQHKHNYIWFTFGAVFSCWTSVTCHPRMCLIRL